MIIDFKDARNGDAKPLFAADIAIVGAGAAGITLARRLMGTGARILLIESGGPDYQKETQDLYAGELSGMDYYELREARLRFFGGTTAIWGGRCARLDGIDFTRRDWVAHSGWPISLGDLTPYYAWAQGTLGLPVVEGNTMPGFIDPLAGRGITSSFWQFDEKFSRFTLPACTDLTAADNVTVLLNATMVGMTTSENGAHVTSADIVNLNGGLGSVTANNFVLAMGGLETPRMMLAIRTGAHPHGIGNNRDQVGRYFMEHPHARAARIIGDDPKKLFRTFPSFRRDTRGNRYGLLLRPNEAIQKRHGILNTCFTIGVYRNPGEKPKFFKKAYGKIKHDMDPGKVGRALWRTTKKITRWSQDHCGPVTCARLLRSPKNGIYAVMRAEQAPNPGSRVKLSEQKDALGIPEINLDWQLLDIDKASALTAMRALNTDLKDLGLGRAEPCDWLSKPDVDWEFDELVTSHSKGGYHHIGTTRMGNDPAKSVVDPQCRVHGMDNLHIAGSSVFPTGGWANPTLTILALALRLGDRLSNSYRP